MNVWPSDKSELFALGVARATAFCSLNAIPVPAVRTVRKEDWPFAPCAYYRPERPDLKDERSATSKLGTGIVVCLEKCAVPCGETGRNWSWPGHTVDREPYGVIAHELGHHCDWLAGEAKGRFYSDYSARVREESGEGAVTGYCDGDHEVFAEWFRLFVTNPVLLKAIRPKTYAILTRRWKPLAGECWREVIGNAPARIKALLERKTARD